METTTDLRSIPNLPGYGFRRKPKNVGRPQTFQMVNGVRVEQQEGVTFERPKLVRVEKSLDSRRHGTMGRSVTTEDFVEQGAPQTTTEVPAWDALDRHVLRFYGHFKEAVVETNLENYRVRHCCILYYLEDDTMHIGEKKQNNSGIPQGQLIRRHRFPSPDGGYLTWRDLSVGMTLNLYGRSIEVVQCDPFTRQFYEDQGMEQGPEGELETDAFMLSQVKEEKPAGQPKTAERMYREVQMGGGHVNADMQQFMEWDRKVCRFYAIMDDLTSPTFERRPFEILFFLVDDTVQIAEKYPLNCGRDNFPIFFKRGKLAPGKAEVCGPLDQPKGKEEMLKVTDMMVGGTVELLGYTFFFYDADEFTRMYFQEELGVSLEPCVDVRLPERAVPRPATPKYTGYGSWEDSLGSVHSLCPKPPKRDTVKLFKKAGQVLRFTAQFANAKAEDQDRLFIINFYLFDDSMQIHEPPQRNLGIITGRFLEKGVHLNQITGQLFTEADLYPGAVIKVYNREFDIIDCDEYTRNHRQHGGTKRHYDLQAVMEKVRESMRQQYPLVRDIFRRFDGDKDGVISMDEFKAAILRFGYQLDEDEMLVLMKHFDVRKDGQISYNEFCDVLLDEDYTQHMMKTKPPLDQTRDPEYMARAAARAEERRETEEVRAAVRAVGLALQQNSMTAIRILKEFGHQTHEQTVPVASIRDALEDCGHIFTVERVTRSVLYILPDVDLEKVPFMAWIKGMITSFHDLAASR